MAYSMKHCLWKRWEHPVDENSCIRGSPFLSFSLQMAHLSLEGETSFGKPIFLNSGSIPIDKSEINVHIRLYKLTLSCLLQG